MGALMGLLSSKGGAAGSALDFTKQGASPAISGASGALGVGGTGAGTGAGVGPLLGSTAQPSLPELMQPDFQTAQGQPAYMPQMTGVPSPLAPPGMGPPTGFQGLLSNLGQAGQNQQANTSNKFLEMLSGFSPGTRAILQFMQRGRQKQPLGSMGG